MNRLYHFDIPLIILSFYFDKKQINKPATTQ